MISYIDSIRWFSHNPNKGTLANQLNDDNICGSIGCRLLGYNLEVYILIIPIDLDKSSKPQMEVTFHLRLKRPSISKQVKLLSLLAFVGLHNDKVLKVASDIDFILGLEV